MSLRRRIRRRHEPLAMDEAVAALTECPPPWEPVAHDLDQRYRRMVHAYGPALLERAEARPDARAWLLVRYLPHVPTEIVERALAAFKREAAAFCELAGGAPDDAAVEMWEARWRASHAKATTRRRAAG